ncbi:MAG: hypothetical protein IID60_09325 [Proteobacteria bacterium]|nr:hypothetical protein [Pseudomonadota bacterium]
MNRIIFTSVLLACCITTSPQAQAQDEIALLRKELKEMRVDYETRISELERRLETAEEKTAMAPAKQPVLRVAELAAPGLRTGSNAFNPAIGVIFQGQAWAYDNDPLEYAIPGFPLGGESRLVAEGFALGETEIDINANVDDKFTTWLTMSIVIEDGEAAVEIEEAWIETLSLPAGFSARFGRMFSNVGYLNEKHAHSWDFVDQPLAYKAFLGGQYIDDGARLSWVAPTDLYIELGGEILRGDRYPFVGAGNSGFGTHTLHARFGGDVGFSHSWQAGISYLSGENEDREAGDEEDPFLFTGDVDVWMAEFVWKWAPNGNWKQRNFKFQFEYLQRRETGMYLMPDGRQLAWNINQDGWYAQAVYQFMPGWRVGARLEALSSPDPGPAFYDTALALAGSSPSRYSLMADWSNSEFSRLRLQYTRDDAGEIEEHQWGLQYIFSIGAHGKHSF